MEVKGKPMSKNKLSIYATPTQMVYCKYLDSDNPVTKWSYKSILQSRCDSGDKLAESILMHLNFIEKGKHHVK